MKYAILIPDGCADLPIESLGGRTPMQAARTPNLDALAHTGIIGRSRNVPDGFSPGSDVATLGLLGYDPTQYYTGRAPLEAAAQGLELGPNDWAIRCNLVTIDNGVMKSFTAGHVSNAEAAELMETLNRHLAPQSPIDLKFYPGVGYRNLAIARGPVPLTCETATYPPHDYTDHMIAQAMPTGPGSDWLRILMGDSQRILSEHPVNWHRIAAGKLPVTHIWLWGIGCKPNIPSFSSHFTSILSGRPLRGGMITAVDLLRGIASLIGWEHIAVPGITGYIDTDYAAKGSHAAEALREFDLVCIHVEATDEASHEGSIEKKVQAMEDIDRHVVPPLLDALKSQGDWRLLVSPDHPTPVALKTHSSDFVPWLQAGSDIKMSNHSAPAYDERQAQDSTICFDQGWEMIGNFLRRSH